MSQKRNGRQRHAAGRSSASSIEAEVSSLAGLTIGELRRAWANRLATEPPAIRSRGLLLRLLAWQMQADTVGGLDAVTERKLRDIAKALERDGSYEPKIRQDLSPGVVLTREWKGAVHKVTVVTNGFQHLGKRYRSLSDIARTITGTRWSGPRFFGLEQKRVGTSRQESA
jgi:hypothetical protein